jgi:hypothetical protein
MRTIFRVRSTAALACACTLAAGLAAFADGNPRTINITVRDAAGTPVPGAQVVLRNIETKGIITTDANGNAQVPAVDGKVAFGVQTNTAAGDVAMIVPQHADDLNVTLIDGAVKADVAPAIKHVPNPLSGLRAPAGDVGGIAGNIPVSCSAGGYSQLPTFVSRQQGVGGAGTLAATSDRDPANGGFFVAENVQATAAGNLTNLCWWGIYLNFSTLTDCSPGPGDLFQITLYSDAGGLPGALKAGPFAVVPTAKFATGNLILNGVFNISEWQFEAAIPPTPVAAGECYWIEISNDTSPDGASCAWLWDTAEPGDGRGAQNGASTDYDLALVVNHAGTICPLPTGACCINGSCQVLNNVDCANAGGAYGGDGTDCGSLNCPTNDECASAQPVTCNSQTTVDNTLAGSNPADPAFSCHFGGPAPGVGSLWYSFVATDVSAQVDTLLGPGSDSLIAVYDACNGTELACGEDFGSGLLSRLCATGLTIGNTYIIQFATFSEFDRGTYTLQVTCPCPPPPANDECAGATAIACNSTTSVNNIDATTNVNDPLFDCRVGGATQGAGSLWYSFVATDTSALLTTDGVTAFDSTIQVFSACGGAVVGCDDDGDEGFLSRLCVEGLTVGSTYIIEFASWAAGAQGEYLLNLTCPCPPPPAGDDCSNAVAIAIPSSTAGDTSAANPSAVPTCSPLGPAAPDVWFSVTGTGNTVTASLCDGGTTYDSAIEVYCGSCAAGLTCVVGLDDFCGLQTQVSWCSQLGATYYVRIHGFAGGAGAFNLVMSDDGVGCTATVQCLPTGACCLPDDSCVIRTAGECASLNGDYAGDGAPCATSGGSPITYTSNPNVAIPDGPFGTVSHTGNVADSRIIGDVNVTLAIDHTWVGDLNVDLTHVNSGTTVRLIERMGLLGAGSACDSCCGCSADNLSGAVLDDEGTGGPIESQCLGGLTSPPNYTPFAPLSAFDGLNSASDWTITACDGAGADVGTIVSWAITTELAGEETCPLCPGDRGDANCDGLVNFFDIDPFLMALFNPAGYAATYCGGDICAVDIDCSGAVNFFDIDPFLACLFSTCPPCP